MPCNLNHSADQRQILDAAGAMLAANYPVSRLRGGGRDDLSALADFGAFALALPEEHGGAGFTLVDEALVHVLLGRHLVSTKVLATSVAVRLAAALEREEMTRRIAAGELLACAAIPTGDTILLIDPDAADLAIVFRERGLRLIDLSNAPRSYETGLGAGATTVRFQPSASAIIGESADAVLIRIAALLASAQLLGVAEASRDLAVSYVKVREQFGRPIGSFQAVKHHCANMAIATEMLSSLLDMAAIAERDGRGDATFQAAALRLLAPKTALANARTCIQLHGGIGFSAEADAHHYLKQAHVLRQLIASPEMLDQPAPLAPYESPKKERPCA